MFWTVGTVLKYRHGSQEAAAREAAEKAVRAQNAASVLAVHPLAKSQSNYSRLWLASWGK